VRKPRDQAKVEVAVLTVVRFVLAKLRNWRFFSLDELNAEVRECVATINAKVMKKLETALLRKGNWKFEIIKRSDTAKGFEDLCCLHVESVIRRSAYKIGVRPSAEPAGIKNASGSRTGWHSSQKDAKHAAQIGGIPFARTMM
jgi:hypothetical protein